MQASVCLRESLNRILKICQYVDYQNSYNKCSQIFGDFTLIGNLSKFKPLFLFIACIFLIFSVSCIYACDDIDDAAYCNHVVADNGLNDGADILIKIDSDADISLNSGDEISEDVHYHKNPKDFDDGKIRSHYRHSHNLLAAYKDSASLIADLSAGNHMKPNNSLLGKARYPKSYLINAYIDDQFTGFDGKFRKNDFDQELSTDFCKIMALAQDKNTEKTIIDNGKGISISNNMLKKQNSINFNNSVNNAVKLDSPLVKGEFCSSKEGECNHELNTEIQDNQKIKDAANIIFNANIIDEDNDGIDDDLAYFYNCNSQIKVSRVSIVSIRNSNEEDINSKNCIFKNILSFKQDLEQINVESSFKNFGSDLDRGIDDFIVNCTACDFDYYGLEINLISAKLNVEDYNLEYYIFTNPYIIGSNVNFKNTPVNNNMQKHCFNANQTITPNINQNNSILNIGSNFNQENDSILNIESNFNQENDSIFNIGSNFNQEINSIFNIGSNFNQENDSIFNIGSNFNQEINSILNIGTNFNQEFLIKNCLFCSYDDFSFENCFFKDNNKFLIKNCIFNAYGEFLIKNYIICDNYGKLSALDCALIKNTTFCKSIASLIEADNLRTICNYLAIMIGQAHIKSNMAAILIG